MKTIKKIFFSIMVNLFISIVLVKNCVYADLILPGTIIVEEPSYYVAVGIVIVAVVGVSIFILRKIYNDNQKEKFEEKEEGEKNAKD